MSKNEVMRLCPNCQGKVTRQDEGKGKCPNCGAMLLSLAPQPTNKMAQSVAVTLGQMDKKGVPQMSAKIVTQTPTNGKTGDQEITWRYVFGWDEEDARKYRSMLGFAQAYHTVEAGDPSGTLSPSYCDFRRKELHQIIDELDATDMLAIHKVARALAVIPRPDGWIKTYADFHDEQFRQRYPDIASQMRQ